jgi:hypothetical protein
MLAVFGEPVFLFKFGETVFFPYFSNKRVKFTTSCQNHDSCHFGHENRG